MTKTKVKILTNSCLKSTFCLHFNNKVSKLPTQPESYEPKFLYILHNPKIHSTHSIQTAPNQNYTCTTGRGVKVHSQGSSSEYRAEANELMC